MGKLTALKIRSMIEPGRYSDGDGLFLEINGKGAASWVLRIQNKGKRPDIGLGSLKAVSLKDAREAAFLTRQKIAQGIDPVAERKQERQVTPTFRKAAEMVHEEHKEACKNGKHQDQWIATLKSYAFPKMGDRLVSEIEGPLIRGRAGSDLADEARNGAPCTAAHRHRSRLVIRTRLSCDRGADAITFQGAASSAQKGEPFRCPALCIRAELP